MMDQVPEIIPGRFDVKGYSSAIGADMRLADFTSRKHGNHSWGMGRVRCDITPGGGGMTTLALRDHAKEILEAVAADLSTPQTKEAQTEKSKGRAPKLRGAETAA
jgi:hypothetical protein